MNIEQLKDALEHLNKTKSRESLAEYIAAKKYGFSAAEAIAIAQAVCAIGCGQPSPGSLCSVINDLWG